MKRFLNLYNKSLDTNLLWIDLEMTGLNPEGVGPLEGDRIIEIATLVTDQALNILAEGPIIAIHQSFSTLARMDEWNCHHHYGSGLIDRVRQSSYDEARAEAETLEFFKAYVPAGKSPMCGNTIYQDRRFLRQYMPKLEKYFHYRHLDVSTLKILAQRWAPELAEGVKKDCRHLAIQDIRDSVAELRYYRAALLKI